MAAMTTAPGGKQLISVQPDELKFIFTLQAQREYPPDMQCRDKFLLQSTVVPANMEVEDLPSDAFTKDSGRVIEECKLRVIYASPTSAHGSGDDSVFSAARGSLSANGNPSSDDAFKRVKEERDAAVRQTQQLQQELEMLKKRRLQNSGGFSFTFVLLVAIIGIVLGFILKLLLSSPTPSLA